MNKEKILLALLPFWTPLIPPLGISCLKGFLQKNGYKVKTLDANTETLFRELYDQYFQVIKECIPGNKRGNFYNIGHDVLQNHMMAFLNNNNKKHYIQLIKQLVFQNYFIEFNDDRVWELHRVIHEFYLQLERYFLDWLEKEKPGVLGLSVCRGTLPASLFAFRLTKEKYPHIKTVMGGSIFSQCLSRGSPNFELFLKRTPYIDKIIIGEGELLFLKWLRDELPGAQRVYTLKDIDGEILNISSLETPDFSDFNVGYYPYLASHTSRSCPFQCTFCAETINWGKYRKKDAKAAAKELVQLSQTHGSQMFLMCDSLLNPIISDLSRELIDAGTSVYWDGYLRVDASACDIDNAYKWRRGGLYRARLGIESGSQNVLNLMQKKITPGQIKTTVANLAQNGIKTTTMWVIGYPGETEADFQQTLDLITEMRDDIYEAECNHFRYFLTGQVHSQQWSVMNKSLPLYPGAEEMLMVQTFILADEPTREETFVRMNRFVRHCNQLGIPNPYTLEEIYRADERWKQLHENAVPPLVDFKSKKTYINENKTVKQLFPAQKQNVWQSDGDFNF